MSTEIKVHALAKWLKDQGKPTGGIRVVNGEVVEFPNLPGVTEPTGAALDAIIANYQQSLATEAASRKGRKQAVLAKMGLQKPDIPALIELIKDENDD